MQIAGLNKTTLLDYPEHVAAVVFTGGCNFCCPYCHNNSLVLYPEKQPVIAKEEIFSFLEKRRGILEGICITGGEPTLQPDLEEFILKVKEMGFLVKLDTNGYLPRVIDRLLSSGGLDYIAMDIKSSGERYKEAAGVAAIDLQPIQESVEIIKGSGIEYEFRTTVVKGMHEEETIEDIGRWLKGSSRYFLQSFKENEEQIRFAEFKKEELEKFASIARKYIDKVGLRGVE